MGIIFDKEPLVVEKNNCATKIANAYIGYELDTQPKVSLNSCKLKNCLFGTTNIVRNGEKSKWVYREYGI